MHERAFVVGCGPTQIGQICADLTRLCHTPAAMHNGGDVRFALDEDGSRRLAYSEPTPGADYEWL